MVSEYSAREPFSNMTFARKRKKRKTTFLFPARIELATFRVLGGRDNHYTTETTVYKKGRVRGIIGILIIPRAYTHIHTPTVVQGVGVGGTPPRSV